MATIQIVLEAINAATRNIDEVATRLEVLDQVQEQAAESARALSDAELAAAQTFVDAFAAVSELRASTHDLAVENVNAALAAEQLTAASDNSARSAFAAATSYARLSDAQLEAANAAVAAGAGFREQDVALLDVTRNAMLAAGGIRAMSAAELDAAANATKTALAVRFLDDAEREAINSTLAWTTALHAESAAQKDAAGAAVVNAAATKAAAASTEASTSAVNGARFAWGFWGAAIRAVNQPITLWGGLLDGLLPKMLTQVGGLHLLADALIEIAAVWGPAIVAAGAWGVAASDAIQEVQRHLTDLHTVADATGQAIAPMTDNLEKLHDAVRPQVYEIFGEALSVATKKGGELNTVIMQTGQVLEQLSARAAMAINSSNMDEFLKNSVNDVRLLGQSFGNLFGILGNLVRMNQGWATILLQTGTSILGLVEHVTALIIPLGQLLVLGHGFVLWVGLAVTAAVKFGATIIGWGVALAGAVTDFVGLIGAIRDFIAVYGLMEALSLVNPLVWVGIAAGALAGLVLYLHSAKDATTTWGDSMQTALKDAQSLSAGVKTLGADQAAVTTRLAEAQTRLNATQEYSATVNLHTGQAVGTTTLAYGEQARKVQELTGIQKTLQGQQETYNTRLNDLAKTYGGVANAQGLLITAGITMKQMLDTSGAAWAMIQQQVEAAYRGYGAMAAQTGVLGNAMQVLDKQQTDQYAAMQKLNQGWDTQISAMTGAMSSFDTVSQGYETLKNNNVAVTISLGKLKEKFDQTKASIDQLTPQGVALNQAFTQQIGQINTLADSWRSAGIAQDLFKGGMAASIAPLEQYAKGSQEATAQLVGLAEEAGYQGPISLGALNKFLGITSDQLTNTAGDMKTMQAASQQATIQQALLTSAMQAQGNYIAGQLIGDINNAILQYNGVAKAAQAYGRAIAEDGRQSDAAAQARKKLIDDLIQSGKAAGDSTVQIAAMIAKVLGIPKSVALQIVMTGTGVYTITSAAGVKAVKASQGAGGSGNAAGGLARGGQIRAKGVVSNKDAIPFMGMQDEVVVPAPMVHAGAVDHLRGHLPGFAAGGQLGSKNPHYAPGGNTDVLTGQYAVTVHQKFQDAMVASMVQAMRSGIKQAAAAAAAAGGGFGSNAGPAGGDASANAAIAKQMYPQWASGALWQAWNYVAMRESGWNRFARNASSGAYGIPQSLPESKLPPAGQSSGGSHAGPQISWMAGYMSGRYGGPSGAAAHERSYNWYDEGGLLPPGPSLAMNQTGQHELVLPPAVILGFTGGLEQLHSPLVLLTGAVHQQTNAIKAQTTATTTAAAAAKAQATAAAKPKPKPAPPANVAKDQQKIAADKANASTLAGRIKAVEQAIKDTPKSDKAGHAAEAKLLKTLESALAKQNKTTKSDESKLSKDIIKTNKEIVAAMQKQIAAISKLLSSGSAGTSKNALWSKLTADEHSLAVAQAAIAKQVSGKSGGAAKVTATVDKASIAGLQAGEVKAFNSAVAKLKSDLAAASKAGQPTKQIASELATLMKRQAAEVAQYNKTANAETYKNLQHLMALAHDMITTAKDQGLSKLPGTAALMKNLQSALTKLANAADAQSKAAAKVASAAAKPAPKSGASSGSASYITGTVTDKKAESELAQLLTLARQEVAELKQVVAVLSKIEKEGTPAAQAKAIGPAVATALNSTSRSAANRK